MKIVGSLLVLTPLHPGAICCEHFVTPVLLDKICGCANDCSRWANALWGHLRLGEDVCVVAGLRWLSVCFLGRRER